MDSRGISQEQYGNETDRHEDGSSDGRHYRFCELPHREPQFGKIYGIGIPDQFSDQLFLCYFLFYGLLFLCF